MRLRDPSQVVIQASPWVGGLTALTLHPQVLIRRQLHYIDEYEKVILEIEDTLRLHAFQQGCNYVLSYSLEVEFDTSISVSGIGQPALLVHL